MDASNGQVAYEAYCEATGGVSSLATGDKLPQWRQLVPQIRDAWDKAAAAVVRECLKPSNN